MAFGTRMYNGAHYPAPEIHSKAFAIPAFRKSSLLRAYSPR